MSIQVKDVSKYYGQQAALQSISFEVKKGEIVGFLGPNGAGKSTLMKIISTYLTADEGRVDICQENVEGNPLNVRQKVGYLAEHNPLYLEMYIKEYLGFVAELYGCSKNRVVEMIEQTGLSPEQHKKIGELSKGYRQRVGLAAALIHEPEVLILDEFKESESEEKQQILMVEFDKKIPLNVLKKAFPKTKIENKDRQWIFSYNGKEDL